MFSQDLDVTITRRLHKKTSQPKWPNRPRCPSYNGTRLWLADRVRGSDSASQVARDGENPHGTPASLPSSDEDAFPIAGEETSEAHISVSKLPPAAGSLVDRDVVSGSKSSRAPTGTIVADPLVVRLDDKVSVNHDQVNKPTEEITRSSLPPVASEPTTAAETESTPAQQDEATEQKPRASRASAGTKIRPRRRRRGRMRYLMQAWSVSLLIHVAILSALAAATFSAKEAVNKILNFDSALAGFRNGEQEVLPIYADPDDIRRDKAVGDENATSPAESVLTAMSEGEGDDGGGSIATGAAGTGAPSRTPKIRGVGKGRINEGTSLPGVKIEGLGGSPISLLPVAPAINLGSGGKIAGDPLFDVKEIGVALDQLAREILRHLKDHKLTVVWLLTNQPACRMTRRRSSRNSIAFRVSSSRISSQIKKPRVR